MLPLLLISMLFPLPRYSPVAPTILDPILTQVPSLLILYIRTSPAFVPPLSLKTAPIIAVVPSSLRRMVLPTLSPGSSPLIIFPN